MKKNSCHPVGGGRGWSSKTIFFGEGIDIQKCFLWERFCAKRLV
jgi:hypothetical protein